MGGVLGLLFGEADSAGYVILTRELHSAMAGFQGTCDYYIFGGGLKHGGICFRTPTGVCGRIELVVENGRWATLARLSTWRPDKATDGPWTTKYSWNMLSVADVCRDLAVFYGKWQLILNNCNHFRDRLVHRMRDSGPKPAFASANTRTTLKKFIETAFDHNIVITLRSGSFYEGRQKQYSTYKSKTKTSTYGFSGSHG
eukprot:m.486695 g.486695  ORF g.486695 m.486695 type:complete len:199 (+) comp24553_c0_seq1:126-722(+)